MEENNQLNGVYTKEDAYRTLEMINNWINNIDTKVSFAMALAGILMGFIFNMTLSDNEGTMVLILTLLLYIANFAALLCFVLAITARVDNPNNAQSIFYFGSISTFKLIDYKEKTNNITEQEILEDLKEQIHTNSLICNKKTKHFIRGVKFLVATIFLLFIYMFFKI